jgi:hypothetical protein
LEPDPTACAVRWEKRRRWCRIAQPPGRLPGRASHRATTPHTGPVWLCKVANRRPLGTPTAAPSRPARRSEAAYRPHLAPRPKPGPCARSTWPASDRDSQELPESVHNSRSAQKMPRRTASPRAAPSHPRHRWPAPRRSHSMPPPRLHSYAPATWLAAAPHAKPQLGSSSAVVTTSEKRRRVARAGRSRLALDRTVVAQPPPFRGAQPRGCQGRRASCRAPTGSTPTTA